METFLGQVAQTLYQRFGDQISDLKIVFPGKRARLFFGQELTALLSVPIWQPEYLAIDDLVLQMSQFEKAENLRLVSELYKVYVRHHPTEKFDKFYRWGEMLLSDFDTIDKYQVDAQALYYNIADLKDIEARFANEPTPEIEIILNFWRSFRSQEVARSHHEREFLRIWHSLYPIYRDFKARLTELGIAYSGMIYREVAALDYSIDKSLYCFLGFNALNQCEKQILKKLQQAGRALFFWDYSPFYLDNSTQEAGLFIRRNIQEFGNDFSVLTPPTICHDIRVISSPTDIMQCKALSLELEKIYRHQGYIGKETAIVLTDEKLLQPTLYSIPPCVEKINITMGYPLTSTVPYLLLERLLQLHIRSRNQAFYHKDVVGILSHPYVVEYASNSKGSFIDLIAEKQSIYIESAEFAEDELLSVIFKPLGTTFAIQENLLEIFSMFSVTDDPQRREAVFLIMETIARLANTLVECELSIEIRTYISILGQMLQSLRIPYEGEPLEGLQILGILETRNVDFKNVIMLSVSDDNFPGNRAGNSYIPLNLRRGFGLPTIADHEAMYSYYFYRLIQRAAHLTMIYNSSTSDQRSGEQSRYIYQLEYESQIEIDRKNINLKLIQSSSIPIFVPKTVEMVADLKTRKFAPSAINRLIDCRLKFYFTDVQRLKIEHPIQESISKIDLGDLLHRVMELLYEPFKGRAHPQKLIASITTQERDIAINNALIEKIDYKLAVNTGQSAIVSNVLRKFVDRILQFDSRRDGDFIILDFEDKVSANICGIRMGGYADRVDRLADGSLRIIDYKSGQGDVLKFNDIPSLFTNLSDQKYLRHNSAALQALIYGMMYRHARGVDATVELYIARLMGDIEYSPLLSSDAGQLCAVTLELEMQLKEELNKLFDELFDCTIPFEQTSTIETCKYCDFAVICKR